MADELKPCPFCEEMPHVYGDIDPNGLVYPGCDCFAIPYPDAGFYPGKWQNRPLEDALRAELAALKEEVEGSYEAFNEQKEELETARQRIKELEEANRWIPVGERLPGFGLRVFVHMENDYEVIASYFPNNWRNDSGQDTHNVTHWRPLPEPPSPEA